MRPEWLSELRAAGTFDSDGEFTIDQAQARAKLRAFQLADPHQFVLNLVAAGVALGCQSITVEVVPGTIELHYAGLTLPADLVQQPLAGLFSESVRVDRDGWRELAIGLNAVLSLQPRRVEVHSGGSAVWVGPVETTPIQAPATGPEAETCIRVSGRSDWRHLLSHEHELPELDFLRQRADVCPVPLTVNGEALARQAWDPCGQQPDRRLRVEFQGQASHLQIWLGCGSQHVTFVHYGVEVCNRHIPLSVPQLDVLVQADRARKNVSGTDLVQDDTYDAIVQDMSDGCDAWLADVAGRYTELESDQQARVRPLLVDALSSRRQQKAVPQLASVPMFHLLSGAAVSANQVLQLAPKGVVFYAMRHPNGVELSDMVVVCMEADGDLSALKAMMGKRLKPSGVELTKALRRQANEARWKASEPALGLSGGPFLQTVTFDMEGYQGAVGVLPPGSDARVTFLKSGRRVADRLLRGTPLGWRACINHDDFTPNSTFDEVLDNALVTRALIVIFEQLEPALAAAAQTLLPPHPDAPALRHVVQAWLSMAAGTLRMPGRLEVGTFQPHLEPFLDYPLLPTMANRLATLRDLLRDKAEFGRVSFVLDEASGPQPDHRQIVVGQVPSEVLRQRFGFEAEDYGRVLRQYRTAQTAPRARLSGEALFPIDFQVGDISGSVGLALPRGTPAAGEVGDSMVRLSVQGRGVETRAMVLAFGPLEAVLDSPALSPNETWDSIIPNRALQTALETLQEACVPLLQKVAAAWPELRDWKREAARRLLLSYLLWQSAAPPDFLIDIELFSTLEGGGVSVRRLQGQQVRWIAPLAAERWRGETDGANILVCTQSEAFNAGLLAGAGAENCEAALQAQALRARFLRQPVVPLSLPRPARAYLHVESSADLQVGLLPPDGSFEGHSPLRLLVAGRLLETAEVPTAIPLEAAVQADSLQPNPEYTAVVRDAAFKLLTQRLRQQVRQAVEALSQRSLRPHDTATLALLIYTVRECPGFLHPVTDLETRLMALPMFEDSTGQKLSLHDVATDLQKRGRCGYVDPKLSGGLLEEGERLVRLSPLEVRWLQKVLHRMVDRSTALQADIEVRTRRDGAPLQKLTVDEPVVERITLSDGLQGQLGISGAGESRVHLVVDGRRAETRPLFDPLPVIGVVGSDGIRANRTWDAVTMSSAVQRDLGRALDALYGAVALRAVTDSTLLLLVLDYFRYRLRHLQSTALEKMEGAAVVPLFDTTEGERASMRDLLRILRQGHGLGYTFGRLSSKPDILCLCLRDQQAAVLDWLSELFESHLVRYEPSHLPEPLVHWLEGVQRSWNEHAHQTVDRARQAAQRVTQGLQQALVRPSAPPQPPTKPERQPIQRAPARNLMRPVRRGPDTANEVLEKLRECLLALTDPKRYELSPSLVWRMRLVDSGPMVQFDRAASSLALNRRHRLLRDAMAQGDTRPRVIAPLACLIYSTVRPDEPRHNPLDDKFLEHVARWCTAQATPPSPGPAA